MCFLQWLMPMLPLAGVLPLAFPHAAVMMHVNEGGRLSTYAIKNTGGLWKFEAVEFERLAQLISHLQSAGVNSTHGGPRYVLTEPAPGAALFSAADYMEACKEAI